MAFFDSNVQPDWVHIDNINEYPSVYLPYPVMLAEKSAGRLRPYVENGGVLISEGLPAYFGDGGHAGAGQPNLGLTRVFERSAGAISNRSIGLQRVRLSDGRPATPSPRWRTGSAKAAPS